MSSGSVAEAVAGSFFVSSCFGLFIFRLYFCLWFGFYFNLPHRTLIFPHSAFQDKFSSVLISNVNPWIAFQVTIIFPKTIFSLNIVFSYSSRQRLPVNFCLFSIFWLLDLISRDSFTRMFWLDLTFQNSLPFWAFCFRRNTTICP